MTSNIYPDGSSVNPLRPGSYQFSVQKLPKVTYFVQQVSVPAITLGVATQASSVHEIKIPGDRLEYDTLSLTFQVDENLENWNSIYFWMFGLGYPEGHHLYREYIEAPINSTSLTELAKGYSEGSLMILNSSNRQIQTFNFIDMFPIQLSGLEFDSTDTSSRAITASVQFAYTYYTVTR